MNHSKRITLLTLTALLAASSAYAEATETGLEMTVVLDEAHGYAVADGRLERAIERLETGRVRPNHAFSVKNNLCVAYARTGDILAAESACTAAIEMVSDPAPNTPELRVRMNRRNQAMALSNRGVVHAMQGDRTEALADFALAVELATDLSAPERNLAVVQPEIR